MTTDKKYSHISLTKNDNATVTFEGELPAPELDKHRVKAITVFNDKVEIDGFRKGHVPEKILLQHVGEYALLQEMAERALAEHYPEILTEHGVDAIGRPDIVITKLALGNPLGFKITTAVMPTVTLPDYKALAKTAHEKNKTPETIVEEKEVDTFIENIRKQKHVADGGKADDTLLPMTDDEVKQFGDFKTIADLREKIKDGMQKDKERQAKEKIRLAILDSLVEKTNLTLPDIIVDAELDKMMAQFMSDIERMGVKPEDYLKKIEKKEEDMRKDFRPDALKRAQIQVILNEIARVEKIEPDVEELKKEVDHILSHHKDADRHSVMIYVATILTNEKVLSFLEQQ